LDRNGYQGRTTVEDQPADPGDLTTDTAETATDEKATRRRHRMPLRKQLAEGEQVADSTAADASTEAVEITEAAAEPAEEAEAAPPTGRRRWRLFRRRPKTPEPETVSNADEVTEPEEEAAPAPRTPVGKAGRTAKPAEEPEADSSAEAEEVAEDVILVPHRPAGKRMTVAVVAAAVLFVGAGAFAGATVQPYLVDRALVATKLDIARTAANAITTLWTYTPDNLDSLPDRSARYLGGDFANEYRKYIDAIVAPNKQAQVTNTTQVMGAAVETVTPSEATAIVYTNSVATSPVSKNIPSLRYLSYRLTLQRHDAKWLITRMSTVTSFDLTPKL
jgi:Mce-associated membrane protein